jgi:hypothetical protein
MGRACPCLVRGDVMRWSIMCHPRATRTCPDPVSCNDVEAVKRFHDSVGFYLHVHPRTIFEVLCNTSSFCPLVSTTFLSMLCNSYSGFQGPGHNGGCADCALCMRKLYYLAVAFLVRGELWGVTRFCRI